MRATDYPLIPLLAVQALWVAARAARLPEAAGPRQGRLGAGPPLRLLVLGDSSAAGVGVPSQDQALAGRLAARLSDRFRVDWALLARTGATARSARALLSAQPFGRFDVAVIALGVNDAKNGVSVARWRRDYASLLDTLAGRCGVSLVCASGVPPLDRFPLLPRPLRGVLGHRAARLDAALADLARKRGGVIHLPVGDALDPAGMAPDGFHPGPVIYDDWARRIAETVRSRYSGAHEGQFPGHAAQSAPVPVKKT